MSDPTRTLPDPLITVDPGRMSGAPCFTGTRVPVQNLFDYVEGGEPLDEFLLDFPNVTRGHAIAVIELTRAAAIELALPNDDVPGALVVSRPDRMGGTPTFVRSRLPVDTLFDYLAAGDPLPVFLDDFEGISQEMVCAVLKAALARAMMPALGGRAAAE